MRDLSLKDLDALWSRHHSEWRDNAQIASQWREAADIDPQLLRYTVKGEWWETLAAIQVTLLITREYEHLVIAMSVTPDGPSITYMPMPHPSGLAVDRKRGIVHIASTRNPNQVYDLEPVTGTIPRLDVKQDPLREYPLVPVRSRFYPGCLYMHDLALISGKLYANAVGQNAVVRLYENGRYEHVWWPKCIETNNGPVFGQNHLQLNSIAAGRDVNSSFYSASTDKISARRPGHKNFPVDKHGIIFSGDSREPVAWGLTRPHSARLHNGKIWVDNSGYGEMGFIDDGRFIPTTQLPGWTRGLCFYQDIAIVGTSRVIPRFSQYAPGLDVNASLCGIHAVNIESGQVLGSLIWPVGNQIFSIDWSPGHFSSGFPFKVHRRAHAREKKLFYAYKTNSSQETMNE